MDKAKLKELILKKKQLDEKNEQLKNEMIEWNHQILKTVGETKISFEDLVIKLIDEDTKVEEIKVD